MRVVEAIGSERRHGRVRARAKALCSAWAAYTLKRAITDVATTSAQDYSAFGLDKAQILAALALLRDEIDAGGSPAARHPLGNDTRRLVVMVARRRPAGSGELQ